MVYVWLKKRLKKWNVFVAEFITVVTDKQSCIYTYSINTQNH